MNDYDIRHPNFSDTGKLGSMWNVQLKWSRCPDGVEVIETTPPPKSVRTMASKTILGEASYGRFLKSRSDMRVEETRTLDRERLIAPVCVALANADTEEKIIEFLSTYGLSKYEPFFLEGAINLGDQITTLLAIACSGDTKAATNTINRQLNRHKAIVVPRLDIVKGQPRPTLVATDLIAFMLLELMAIVEAGASVVTCEYCDRLFLTGHCTTRRSTARFCKDKCRTYWRRNRERMSH